MGSALSNKGGGSADRNNLKQELINVKLRHRQLLNAWFDLKNGT